MELIDKILNETNPPWIVTREGADHEIVGIFPTKKKAVEFCIEDMKKMQGDEIYAYNTHEQLVESLMTDEFCFWAYDKRCDDYDWRIYKLSISK